MIVRMRRPGVRAKTNDPTTGARLPPRLYAEIRKRADVMGLHYSDVVQDAVLDWIQRTDATFAAMPRPNPVEETTEQDLLENWARLGASKKIELAGRLARWRAT